ncbi:MAG: GNAT family N-acetyltransferase [Filomicrobium sp.]
MNNNTQSLNPDREQITVRPLEHSDLADFCRHLVRLDRRSRWMRFNHAMDDGALQAYALNIAGSSTCLIGAYDGETLRAVVELSPLNNVGQPLVELAFTVEPEVQNCGIGSKLMKAALEAIGEATAVLVCRSDNTAMCRVAERFGGVYAPGNGLVTFRIQTEQPAQATEFASYRSTSHGGDNLATAYGYA